MVLQLTLRHDIGKVEKYARSFPKSLGLESHKASITWAKMVQKSAKLRAPRWTGHLASKIKVTSPRKNNVQVVSDAYYGAYQELGYAPHYVSFIKHPILLEWQKQKYGGASSRPGMGSGKKRNFFVKKFKPYIGPAVLKYKGKLPGVFIAAIRTASKRSR